MDRHDFKAWLQEIIFYLDDLSQDLRNEADSLREAPSAFHYGLGGVQEAVELEAKAIWLEQIANELKEVFKE